MPTYSNYTDPELTNLLKAGDHAAFAEIYERYFGILCMHAFNRLKDMDDAKDVVQELFTTLWSKCESITFNSSLSNYLYKAVRNRILNTIARKDVESKYVSSLPQLVSLENCITDHRIREIQLMALIEKEIQALPPKMRKVFELSRKEKLSHKEIAYQLDLSEQSVRSHVKNALKILRVRLGLIAFLICLLNH